MSSNNRSNVEKGKIIYIYFNETFTEATPPPDPIQATTPPVGSHHDHISENVDGYTAISVTGVKSEYSEIRNAILKRSKKMHKHCVYNDQEFPAKKQSLYYTSRPPAKWDDIVWKRPHELSRNPRLIQDHVSSEDVLQGSLGDCWFLASCAAISQSPKLMKKVIPSDQKMTGSEYVGMFHFRFWRFGSWVDVIVDDSLPTLYGQLGFAKSDRNNEFWCPLVEKAYAKLNKSYQAIEGGFPEEGMEDLTGGIAVMYNLGSKTPDHLFRTLNKALRHESFVCSDSKSTEEKWTGLVSNHAYTVLRAAKVSYMDGKVNLIKIRNPWGDTEWKGDWSDNSCKWNSMDQATKKYLGYDKKNNGEWWMAFDDFTKYFRNVTICSIGPDFDNDGIPTGDKWLLSTINGEWIPGVSAGGCRNDIDSYVTNPQYFLELKEADDFHPAEDHSEHRGKCHVIFGLMQESRRTGRADGLKNLFLGCNIFKVSEKPSGKLNAQFFRRNREVANSGTYTNLREVTITIVLEPGCYVIVPSTFYAKEKGNFLVRIYTEKKINVEELQ